MILLTGVTGYLGKIIYTELKKKNFIIYGSSRSKTKPADLFIDFEKPKFKISEIKKLGIKVIIHQVSINQKDSEIFPKLANKVSIEGTTKLIELAKKIGVEKIIYFSTSHVYGKNLIGSVSEKTKIMPINNYSNIHSKVEKICNNNSKFFTNGIFILRLSNIIGSPRRKNIKFWKLVCNELCYQAIKNKKIIINSSGKQFRDFLSIDNLIEVIEKIILNKNFKNNTHIFNVGSGKSITILELAKIIQIRCNKLFAYRIIIKTNKQSIEDLINYKFEIKKLNSHKINFTSNNFIESIDNTLKYCFKYKN